MDREQQFFSRLRERLALITPDQRTVHPGARPESAMRAAGRRGPRAARGLGGTVCRGSGAP